MAIDQMALIDLLTNLRNQAPPSISPDAGGGEVMDMMQRSPAPQNVADPRAALMQQAFAPRTPELVPEEPQWGKGRQIGSQIGAALADALGAYAAGLGSPVRVNASQQLMDRIRMGQASRDENARRKKSAEDEAKQAEAQYKLNRLDQSESNAAKANSDVASREAILKSIESRYGPVSPELATAILGGFSPPKQQAPADPLDRANTLSQIGSRGVVLDPSLDPSGISGQASKSAKAKDQPKDEGLKPEQIATSVRGMAKEIMDANAKYEPRMIRVPDGLGGFMEREQLVRTDTITYEDALQQAISMMPGSEKYFAKPQSKPKSGSKSGISVDDVRRKLAGG